MAIKQTKTGWRSSKVLIQAAEYLVGGSVYFWAGLAIFAVCFDVLHWRWWIAKGLSDIFGWSANFTIQRYWAFYNSKLKGHSRRVVLRYMVVNAVDFIFDYLIVGLFIYNNVTPYAGFLVSAAFTTVWDYLWYRFWVFKSA